jgi:octanoyl-[GcvH]:protein N-octanoyltransferase
VLRVHVHRGPVVAFGRRDTFAPGYPAALDAAAAHGCAAIERLAGGRAAVYHAGTLEVGEVLADEAAALHLRERFAATAEVLVEALRALDVDARIGSVPGEYCPGDFSVNARGALKLAGSAQRVVRRAAYVGTVLVVEDAAFVEEVVRDVYAALGLEVSAGSAGAVAGEQPGIGTEAVADAVIAAFARRHELEPGTIDDRTLAIARELEPRFRPTFQG